MFKAKKNGFYFFLALLAATLLLQLLILDQEKNPLFKAFYWASSSLQSAKSAVHLAAGRTLRRYIFLSGAQKENRRLKALLREMEAKQSLAHEIKAENQRLRRMIGFRERKDIALLPAKVIAYDLIFQNPLMALNKGSRDGVEKYMGVLHPSGAVGHIFRVSRRSSQAVTLMNKLSALPALSRKSRTRGLILPSKQGSFLLFKHFELTGESLRKGDKIISAKSQRFPQGLAVGAVASLREEKGEKEALVKPALDFSSLEEVFVILHAGHAGSAEPAAPAAPQLEQAAKAAPAEERRGGRPD